MSVRVMPMSAPVSRNPSYLSNKSSSTLSKKGGFITDLEALNKLTVHPVARDKLKKVFGHFDKNGDGELERREFGLLLLKMCATFREPPPSDDLIDDLMKAVDVDWDGKINFDEFISFMKDFPILFELFRIPSSA